MSGEIIPIPAPAADTAAGTQRLKAVATAKNKPLLNPADALRGAIEREFADLRQGVEALVSRMYRKWGRPDGREAIVARAEEVLQELVARALRQAGKYDPARPAHAWLLRFAVYVLQEQEREEWKHQRSRVDMEAEHETESAACPTTMLDRLHDLKSASEQRVQELLSLVSPQDAALLRSTYIQDMTGREMAAELGISEGALRVRLHRAGQRLRIAYQRAEQFGVKEH